MSNRLTKSPSEYLSMMYYDALVYHPGPLQALLSLAPPDHFFFGTDHPFFAPLQPDDLHGIWPGVNWTLDAIRGLPQERCDDILFGNAVQHFLGLPFLFLFFFGRGVGGIVSSLHAEDD